jgi:uncharacterized protein YxjI
MELCIRNKWISLSGSSVIKDINENDVYKLKGKFWTVTRKKFLRTLDDKDLYIIRNKFWTFFVHKAFVINPDNTIAATIRRKYFSVHDRYFIDCKYGKVEITGNILGFNYHILLDGKEIGHVARRISLRDSFVLTIDDNVEDIPFFVSLVIAIDNITDQRRSESN